MKNLMSITILFASLVLISSCKKDDDTTQPGVGKEVTIDVTYLNKPLVTHFFSFAKGDTVTITNQQNSNDWDLGLYHRSFVTNSGRSGKGKGGVIDMGAVNFDDVITAPTSGYVVDDSVYVITKKFDPKTGPVMTYIPGSIPLEGCFAAPVGAGARTYAPNNHVYVIRTADGKYAKFWAKTFFSTAAVEGFTTFRYYYQPDGSTNLKEAL